VHQSESLIEKLIASKNSHGDFVAKFFLSNFVNSLCFFEEKGRIGLISASVGPILGSESGLNKFKDKIFIGKLGDRNVSISLFLLFSGESVRRREEQ
jgi:hypothetical protein